MFTYYVYLKRISIDFCDEQPCNSKNVILNIVHKKVILVIIIIIFFSFNKNKFSRLKKKKKNKPPYNVGGENAVIYIYIRVPAELVIYNVSVLTKILLYTL